MRVDKGLLEPYGIINPFPWIFSFLHPKASGPVITGHALGQSKQIDTQVEEMLHFSNVSHQRFFLPSAIFEGYRNCSKVKTLRAINNFGQEMESSGVCSCSCQSCRMFFEWTSCYRAKKKEQMTAKRMDARF